MELKQLQYFVVSADCGSLSKAAEVLYTTQPHVSMTIKQLEKQLGVELLTRGRQGVMITESGRQVYEYAREILQNVKMIEELPKKMRTETLKMIAMPWDFLEEVFADFYRSEGALQAKLLCGEQEAVLHQTAHRHVQMGFLFTAENRRRSFEERIGRQNLQFIPLKGLSLFLNVGPRNAWYEKKSIPKRELPKLKLARNVEGGTGFLQKPGHLREELWAFDAPPEEVVVQSTYALNQLLEKTDLGSIGFGLGASGSKKQPIHRILIEDCAETICFGYVCHGKQRMSSCGERFLEFLKRALEN